MRPREQGAILVIGGGIAGITAAVEAAEVGHPVFLVEREPYLGGRVLRTSRYFPKLCPPSCGLEINFRRIRKNPRITLFTMAEVTEIRGQAGQFSAKVHVRPRYVDEKCTGCGKCAEACQKEIPNPFNHGLDRIKAAYLPNGISFPQRFVLSPEIIGREEGRRLRDICPYGAIDPHMTAQVTEIEAASVIVATGWEPYDAATIENMGLERGGNIISNVLMERLAAPDGPTGGKILRPSDRKEVKTIAFAQCAGQRDENHLPYCSRVCCLASLKQALYLREQDPDTRVYIFYIDLRAYGRGEDFLARVRADRNVEFIRGKVARAETDLRTGDVLIEAESTDAGQIVHQQVDLLVLATGMVPSSPFRKISGPAVPHDSAGFVLGFPGILGAGCVHRPLDVSGTVMDATAAAMKAIQWARNKKSAQSKEHGA